MTIDTEAAEELRAAREELGQGARRTEEFLAILAHELRNPLAPLRSALAVLKKADATSAAAIEARDIAERQVGHLTRLVDDLLDVARITHGRIELKKGPVELALAVSHAVETVRPTLRAQGHELTIDIPERPIWLDADEVRLTQILSNLLNNAAQYTAPRGKVAIQATQLEDEVEIRVIDTGLGIAPEALPRVFDMFTQVGPPELRAPSSLGIGLRLVKGLVEMHGGRIEARSDGVGRGSVFVVRLPVGKGPGAERREASPPSQGANPSRRILIVDDNADAAASIAVLLSFDGHHTRVAADGRAALEAIAAETPDIVFLDIGMPGMDGYEVARRIRRQSHLARVKLVALTGWGQAADRKQAREAGFDRHLTKPVEPAALQAVIAGIPG